MNNKYSPSRIGTFDKCKLQYRYHYIDNLPSDLETVENFMGSRVHEALEEFYKLIKGGKVESLDWLLNKYEELWNKNYTEDIKIVKSKFTIADYFNNGKQCLINYYNQYQPFNQTKIVDTERLIFFNVESEGVKFPFNGKLDRLDWNDKENIFEIHDYKTGRKLITQEEADNDWQLGLYHLAIKKKWPADIEKIKLIWHFLTMNKEITSFRTEDQISNLQKSVVEKVKEIESCNDFFPQKSALCDWCDYQNICPLWKHPKKMEDLSVNEYKKDPGVKLVSAYKELEERKHEFQEEIRAIEEEQGKISEAAVDFAKKNNISIIDGSDARLKVDIKDELRTPTKAEDEAKWWSLRDFLIKEGKYQDVSTVNANMMTYKIKEWPAEFVNKISKFLIKKTTEVVRLIKKY